MLSKQTVSTIFLILLALGLVAIIVQAAPATQTSLDSPLSTPSRFDSPLPTPIPCPSSVRWSTLTIEVKIEGLKGKHFAELQLLTDTSQTAACLSARGTKLPELRVRNGSRDITIADIPDGSYKLIVDAPADYFREPRGYLFQVSGGQIVRYPGHSFHFRLTPPSDQDMPPCRNFAIQPGASIHDSAAEDVPFEPQAVCRAERLIDVSAPPK